MALNVLQIVPSYYPAFVYGGPIFSIHAACQALARQGVAITVATTNANGDRKLDVDIQAPVAFAPNYNVRYYDETIIGRFSWAFTRHAWRDIRAASVVHLQDIYSACAVWTLLLTALQRKPLLISPRGVFTPWGLATKRPWLKAFWNFAFVRPFVGNNRRVAWHATAPNEHGEIRAVFPQARIVIIPNAIDCTDFDQANRLPRPDYLSRFFPACAVPADQTVVLVALGRLHAKKAFDVAIRAVASLATTHPHVVLLIAGGDGGEAAALQRLISQCDLGGRVRLVGEIEGADKVAFLKGADVFVFPSHGENFGMVCLEALAAGLPVIASRETPWAELETLGSGLWVENTPEAFATALQTMLNNSTRHQLQSQARAHAGRYDLSAMATAFQAAYLELVDAR